MELGSEFHIRFESLKEEQNTIYSFLKDFNTIYVDSGRSGLRLLCETLNEGEILLPEYICDSVLQCFSGKNIKFYQLESNLKININDLYNKINSRTSVVYLMHYFGSMQSQELCSFLEEKRIEYGFTVIEDTTHSIFSNPITIGDYCICSLRKWFAIPDGGVLYSRKPINKFKDKAILHNTDISKVYGMILKTLYLDGVLDCNAIYREIFQLFETKLDEKNEVFLISELSRYLLTCIDINSIIASRRLNYKLLKDGLEVMGLLPICSIDASDCPFTFPIRVENRDYLRKYFINNKIYCAVHWPLKDTELYNIETARKLSEQIISLPMDQRYGSEEIEYLLNVIKKYVKDTINGNNISLR